MATVDSGGSRAYCLFAFGAKRLAVGVDAVEGFTEPARLVRLPLCPRIVAGVCTYRGGLLPVIEPAAGATGRPSVLILRTGHGLLGLLISRGETAVVEAGDILGSEEGESPLPGGLVAAGAVERGGIACPVLDLDRTWAAVRRLISGGHDAGRSTGIATAGGEPGASGEGQIP
jgi:hypothetical protein